MKNGTNLTSLQRPARLATLPIARVGGLFVSPGYGTHPDRVCGSWELVFVRSGTLHIEENGSEFRVATGESLLLPQGRRHRGLSEHPEDLSFYWIHFTLGEQPMAPALRLPQHARLTRPDRLAELFHQFVSDQTAGQHTRVAANALLLLMLNETTIAPAVARSASAISLVQKAEEHISHRMRQGTSPGEVARALGYNTAYLSRLFREVHGVTLGGFIHRVQVAHAKVLLRDSAAPLKQIASRCGFHDVGYFRRVFRSESSISPREYRNRFGLVHINRD